MSSVIYNNAKKLIGDGTIDWDNGSQTYRCLLTTSSYAPNIDTHTMVSDVTNELSGTGYARKDLASRAVTVDNTNDRAGYSANNVTWSSITAGGATAAKCVVYKFNTSDADSPVIACLDITPTVLNGGDFTVAWNGGGSSGDVFQLG
jgi:hypothetical protein